MTKSVPILKTCYFFTFMCLFGKITSNTKTALCVIAVQSSCNIRVGNEAFLGKKVGFTVKFQFKFQLLYYCVITFLNLSEPFFIQKTEILLSPSWGCCINKIMPVIGVANKRCNVLASKSLADWTNFSQ